MFKLSMMIKFLITILAILKPSQAQSSCEFNISSVPSNEPVYLEKNSDGSFKFFQPTNQVTLLPFNKEITLLCPVSGNFFVDGECWGRKQEESK
jgi:hypothetical protein